jgi:lysozyme
MAKRKPTLRFDNKKNNTPYFKTHIKELNQRLVWWGELDEQYNNDLFSTHTLDAVLSFQLKKQLVEDGVVGAKTWNALLTESITLSVEPLNDVEKVEIITQCGENGCYIEPQKHEDLTAGIALLKQWEGLRLAAYPDSGTGDKPITIGYGSTIDIDGKPFQLGRKITKDYAEDLLRIEIAEKYLPQLRKIPYWHEMNSNQQGALLSFAWNLGAYFYGADGFETITRVLRSKEWSMVPKALMLYVNPGSSVEKGLRNRRQAEGQLWSKR